MKISKAVKLLPLLTLCACASITKGTTQPIDIVTTPAESICKIDRNGANLGSITTPGSLTIDRTKDPIIVTCSKKGYLDSVLTVRSGQEGMVMGNLIAGGLIGWGVDSATGADNKYESPVSIVLQRK